MFFTCDHYRLYELRNKAKASAYLTASIIQQLTNTRTDKTLTSRDFACIVYAYSLNFFHTNTMFNPWKFGMYCAADVFWIKRISDNSYQCQNCFGTSSIGISPSEMRKSCGSITTKTKKEISSMHPDLVCEKDGDERVLIEYCYRKATSFNKQKLGLFILEPRTTRNINNTADNVFFYTLVITPKPGLFPGKH
ncbi:MAG: hypothetical protein IJT36_07380 [Alphaproteobacteria bacterium]|nr:hypothetical protein [Alphaproteobacteria bacterium]